MQPAVGARALEDIPPPKCLCSSTEFSTLREGSFGFFPVEGRPVPFKVLTCRRCGLCVTSPPPGRHIAFLSTQQRTHIEQDEGEMLLDTSRYRLAKILSKLSGPPRAALEIGCSTGPLVEMLSKAGAVESVGVELHQPAVNGALRRGRNVRGQSLHDCQFQDAHFDLIQAHHVLEHVPDLHGLLAELTRVLQPGGLCYFTVPCHATLLARSDDWSGWFPQEHFWHFTRETLLPILTSHGLIPCGTSRPMLTDFVIQPSVAGAAKRLARAAVRELGWGDTLEVWARRLG